MTRARLFVLVVILSLVVAAVALSPKRDEQAAMLAAEGRHAEAVALLERRLAEAPGDPDLLAALARSRAALGDTGSAITALDGYLAVRPGDSAAREREAGLFLQDGRLAPYLDALARATAARPTPARVARLVALYRLHGLDDDELRTLEGYARMRTLGAEELERLGALLAARGEWGRAKAWLDEADRAAPPEASDGRLMLLDVAIATGAVDRLAPRLEAWMAGWRSPYLSGRLLLRVARSGNAHEAARLAGAYADVAPDDALAMAGFLAGKGFADLGRRILVRWSARTDADDASSLHVFAALAARLGEPQEALRKLLRLADGEARETAVAPFAEELVDAFGADLLPAVRPFLPASRLAPRPLFAAEVAEWDGNPEAARWYLRKVDLSGLSPAKAAAWLALCRRLQMEPEAKAALARAGSEGRLPEDLLPASARGLARRDPALAIDLIWRASGG